MSDLKTTRLLVKKILENATNINGWSLQGLGMLRFYLSTEIRLHVWDSRFKVPNVSTMHNHPWSFDSYVVAGEIQQRRYVVDSKSRVLHDEGSLPFKTSVLKCGAGNCELTPSEFVWLKPFSLEVYKEGQHYTQEADEIHDSFPKDGTVTLVTRRFTKADVDHASVFWPDGQEWVSAEPRPAKPEEVFAITSSALERWFSIK